MHILFKDNQTLDSLGQYIVNRYRNIRFLFEIDFSKDELLKLLEVELDDFVNRNIVTTAIIGHNIRIVATDGQYLMVDDLDEEVYEISQLILDGNECRDIFIKSLGISGFWNIVQ